MIAVRPETPDDIPAVHAVNAAAFPAEEEANLVDALREQAAHVVSLVAELDGEIVGHILFSPAHIETESDDILAVGLAPMSVLPAHQRSGIGSRLVEAGLNECRRLGHRICIVLGHPDYYPRFGFTIAAERGISCEFDSPPEAFMLLALEPGALNGLRGTAKYHRAFQDL